MTHAPDTAEPAVPQTDDVARVYPVHGADRSGLGERGWAEVPDDLIGHPEQSNDPNLVPKDRLPS